MTITYKEFSQEIDKLGYKVVMKAGNVFVETPIMEHTIISVSIKEVEKFKVYVNAFRNINPGESLGRMFYLAHLLSATPIEKRGEKYESIS